MDRLVGDRFQKADFDGGIDGGFMRFPFEVSHGRAELEKIADGHVIVERGGLGQVANFTFCEFGLIGHRDPADLGIAAIGAEESGDHPHGCGLSSTIGTKESEDLTLINGEREVINDSF